MPELIERASKAKATEASEDECLNPNCNNKAKSRGLCFGCSAAARRAIKAGVVTEDELVEKGKMLPTKRATSEKYDWLTDFVDDDYDDDGEEGEE